MTAWMLLLQKQHSTEWMRTYMKAVPPIIASYGGAYVGIARDVTVAENELTKPAPPEMDIVGLFSFPSREKIEAFLASEEYRPYSELRKQNTTSDIFILDGLITDFTRK